MLLANFSATITLMLLLIIPDNPPANCSKIIVNGTWHELGKIATLLLQKCLRPHLQRNHYHHLQECLKRRSLLAIDRALSRDVIEIGQGIALMKWKSNGTDGGDRYPIKLEVTGKSFGGDWSREFFQRVMLFFKTRVLKMRLSSLEFSPDAEGRHRRKNNMMGQLMMFGMVAAGMIVIPMGFQFLAVLGGKALLLAKLALLLTSIQGLKKIATSHVNYGLYSTGLEHHHDYHHGIQHVHHGHGHDHDIHHEHEPYHYDRQWPYEMNSYAPGDTPHPGVSFPISQTLQPRQDIVTYTIHD
ncbi:uncharacterized protein LOC132700886 isoform X2 [Cylas formicarius]|uniref:uncharacterized protein LOC132700886 isoform X2 n=1 Tax=Cylas formicarius TaxID=197179 RepID=UPI002958A26D|nr:uncharacterized protein LOC132700886 isoform X2 [Cylas formicarius]